MQNSVKRKTENLRIFKVGLIGANADALNAFRRIFSVTRYRTRSYEAVPVIVNARSVPDDVDFLILCSSNPNVRAAWESGRAAGKAAHRPIIFMSRKPPAEAREEHEYVIALPVNPSRLLKELDRYTIKELNFFPEFEIGNDDTKLCANTIEGLKLLRSDSASTQRVAGLHRALMVDDSLAVRKQMEIEFGLLDTQVDLASSAEAALSAIETTRYDIIFLDVVMPGMDGYSVCKKIKRSRLNRNTPVVLLTSRSSKFDRIKGTLAGCDTYLVKPITHNDFEKVVGQYFQKRTG